jgi:hypothetical protein
MVPGCRKWDCGNSMVSIISKKIIHIVNITQKIKVLQFTVFITNGHAPYADYLYALFTPDSLFFTEQYFCVDTV